MTKLLKCAGNDDIVTMKAEDSGDILTLMFESPQQERVADFEMKLMDIDSEHLAVPETEYHARIKMPANEYQRICRDLSSIGDTVTLTVSKDGVRFSTSGDIGSANITCRHSTTADKEGSQTHIELVEPVSLTFALRYLSSFAKATPLSDSVTITITKDLPVVVEYGIADMGHLRSGGSQLIREEASSGAMVGTVRGVCGGRV